MSVEPSLPAPEHQRGEVVLQTAGLTKDYGKRRVVDSLDLTVRAGDIYGFLGPNGAGKSTTIRMVAGLIRPTAGSALLMGHDVRRHPTHALREVGAQVESPALYRHLSGYRNLRLLAGMSGHVEPTAIDRALERVRLTGREHDKVGTYSQGMRARLAIALAMLPMPRLLILDEPTNGLDPQGMKEVRELVGQLAREDRVTVFISSHLLHEIQLLCDRVAVINQGRLVVEGRVDELLSTQETSKVLVGCDDLERAGDIARGVDGVLAAGIDRGGLTVELPTARIADLNAALVGAGIRVHELTPERPTLEDYFLRVTAGSHP